MFVFKTLISIKSVIVKICGDLLFAISLFLAFGFFFLCSMRLEVCGNAPMSLPKVPRHCISYCSNLFYWFTFRNNVSFT